MRLETRMTPIIKPVGDYCNQKCTYCFYYKYDQGKVPTLGYKLLEKFISEYLSLFEGKLSFIWHGGEPLLAGIEFYNRAISIQRLYVRQGQEIANYIQTNATLITREWAHFFKKHNFKVGISLDGNESIHDLCRIDKKGRGTFNKVKRGLDYLEESGVKYGVVQVFTKEHVGCINEIFNYFVNDLNLKQWSINAFVDTCDTGTQDKFGLSNDEFIHALKQYFEMWIDNNDHDLKIREIENLICGAFDRLSAHCTFAGTCTRYLCLNNDGKIYPCDSFTNNPELCFGDLAIDSLENILTGSNRSKYVDTVDHVHPECSDCEWLDVCHNGCTSQRVGGVGGKYYYCDTRKEMFKFVKDYVAGYR